MYSEHCIWAITDVRRIKLIIIIIINKVFNNIISVCSIQNWSRMESWIIPLVTIVDWLKKLEAILTYWVRPKKKAFNPCMQFKDYNKIDT